jgi:hypothetical protein
MSEREVSLISCSCFESCDNNTLRSGQWTYFECQVVRRVLRCRCGRLGQPAQLHQHADMFSVRARRPATTAGITVWLQRHPCAEFRKYNKELKRLELWVRHANILCTQFYCTSFSPCLHRVSIHNQAGRLVRHHFGSQRHLHIPADH